MCKWKNDLFFYLYVPVTTNRWIKIWLKYGCRIDHGFSFYLDQFLPSITCCRLHTCCTFFLFLHCRFWFSILAVCCICGCRCAVFLFLDAAHYTCCTSFLLCLHSRFWFSIRVVCCIFLFLEVAHFHFLKVEDNKHQNLPKTVMVCIRGVFSLFCLSCVTC